MLKLSLWKYRTDPRDIVTVDVRVENSDLDPMDQWLIGLLDSNPYFLSTIKKFKKKGRDFIIWFTTYLSKKFSIGYKNVHVESGSFRARPDS